MSRFLKWRVSSPAMATLGNYGLGSYPKYCPCTITVYFSWMLFSFNCLYHTQFSFLYSSSHCHLTVLSPSQIEVLKSPVLSIIFLRIWVFHLSESCSGKSPNTVPNPQILECFYGRNPGLLSLFIAACRGEMKNK